MHLFSKTRLLMDVHGLCWHEPWSSRPVFSRTSLIDGNQTVQIFIAGKAFAILLVTLASRMTTISQKFPLRWALSNPHSLGLEFELGWYYVVGFMYREDIALPSKSLTLTHASLNSVIPMECVARKTMTREKNGHDSANNATSFCTSGN